jgi:antitoxin ParD1/3/4
MASNTVNISLPDPLKAYLEARVAEGDYGTPGDFIRELIRQDRDQRRERLESALLEAQETRPIAISSEELRKQPLVAVLREKLARS